MARGVAAYCHDCRSRVRSMIEHRATAKHRASTTSIRSSGPKGSSPYRGYTLPAPDSAYDAYLEQQYLDSLPPTIDELFPLEIMDAPPEAPTPERGYRPEPCGRCGATFRTPAGRSWHMTRNTRCERWRPARARIAS